MSKVSVDKVEIDPLNPNALNDLLPRRKSFVPLLIPLILVILLIGALIVSYFTFVKPLYDEADKVKQESEEIITSLVGYTVTGKEMREDCARLILTAPDEKLIKSVCVPEELWDLNTVDEVVVVELPDKK